MKIQPPMWLVANGGALVIRTIGATWRVRTEDRELFDRARTMGPQLIFSFWHGRLLPLLLAHSYEKIHVLASEHADGEMLGQTIRRLGYGHVRGSSTRGGMRALRELSEKVRAGFDVGLTVDGPRGPRGVVKSGAIEVARQTGAVIIPLTSASEHHKTFSSWDAFELPHPFSRVVVRYGEPMIVSADANRAEVEARRLDLERELTRITAEADRSARGEKS